MTTWYLDTSAALKLLNEEPESAALARTLDEQQPQLVACWLLETELRRTVQGGVGLTHEAATDLLDMHLAAALRIGVDVLVTCDTRMADAARPIGLTSRGPRADLPGVGPVGSRNCRLLRSDYDPVTGRRVSSRSR